MPLKSFFTRSHDHRKPKTAGRAVLADKSPNTTPSPRPRLRRVQAYSDLTHSIPSPSSARTVSITVKKKAWLEEAANTIRCMSLMDKENIDPLMHQPSIESFTAASEFSFVDETFDFKPRRPRITLQRKHKSSDLRSQYSGPSSETGEDSDITMSSMETATQESEVQCACGEEFEAASGEVVGCDVCTGLFHLGCVGHDRRGVGFFKKDVFFCPSCEQTAFREIAAEGA